MLVLGLLFVALIGGAIVSLFIRWGPFGESLSVILCARHNRREGAYYAEQIEEGSA